MSAPWHPLPWDSEFFGFPIGRVALDGLDAAAIAQVDAEAREQGIVCLFGSHDASEHGTSDRVQSLGYRFVEAATMFSLAQREPEIPRPEGISVRLGTEDDLPALSEVVALLAPWSRFAVDPRFGPEAALRMQSAFVERAARCRTGEFELLLAEDEGGIVAFITRATHPEPVIDTVGTLARGSGAARYLVQATRPWAGDRALLGGPIAARNVHALRYVANCGYRVAWVRYLYHRWLDDQGQGR